MLVATVAQGRAILRGCWHLIRGHAFHSISIFIMAMALGAVVWPHDQVLLQRLHGEPFAQDESVRDFAWYLSTWGDYPTYNVPLSLIILLYGVWKKSHTWRRVAMICFLGGSLAGLFDDFFRLTLGRPRPDTLMGSHVTDGFYGITYAFSGGYQSFPSGHAASVFGTAAALLVTELPLGILTTLFALAVVWARMELYRHYPSDVLVGSVIGIYFGLIVGFGARVRRTRVLH